MNSRPRAARVSPNPTRGHITTQPHYSQPTSVRQATATDLSANANPTTRLQDRGNPIVHRRHTCRSSLRKDLLTHPAIRALGIPTSCVRFHAAGGHPICVPWPGQPDPNFPRSIPTSRCSRPANRPNFPRRSRRTAPGPHEVRTWKCVCGDLIKFCAPGLRTAGSHQGLVLVATRVGILAVEWCDCFLLCRFALTSAVRQARPA